MFRIYEGDAKIFQEFLKALSYRLNKLKRSKVLLNPLKQHKISVSFRILQCCNCESFKADDLRPLLLVELLDFQHGFGFELELPYIPTHLLSCSSLSLEKSKSKISLRTASVMAVSLMFNWARDDSFFRCRTPSLPIGFDSSILTPT